MVNRVYFLIALLVICQFALTIQDFSVTKKSYLSDRATNTDLNKLRNAVIEFIRLDIESIINKTRLNNQKEKSLYGILYSYRRFK